ncbi:helix-turn-helix domain-containing protein [Pseudomonas aeruginosa]|nr:helix-turn-helix domain-containing protein [Pseudomonas aeruginosa]
MSRIETGGANPSLDAIKVLADALGTTISELFF